MGYIVSDLTNRRFEPQTSGYRANASPSDQLAGQIRHFLLFLKEIVILEPKAKLTAFQQSEKYFLMTTLSTFSWRKIDAGQRNCCYKLLP